MIVKWLGMKWYVGTPEDEQEDVPARWACFALQVLALVLVALLYGKMLASEIAAADNPLVHYADDEPDPQTQP